MKKRQKNYLWRHLLLVVWAFFGSFSWMREGFELMTCKREELALTIIPTELFSLPCLTMFQFLSYRPEFFFILCRLQIEFDQSNIFMYIPVRPGICNLKKTRNNPLHNITPDSFFINFSHLSEYCYSVGLAFTSLKTFFIFAKVWV